MRADNFISFATKSDRIRAKMGKKNLKKKWTTHPEMELLNKLGAKPEGDKINSNLPA